MCGGFEVTGTQEGDRDWQAILEWVLRARGFDGGQYKPNYLKRRVAVRMRTVGAATYGDYRRILERDPREPDALLKRLTIHVTEFFRDPEVYRALEAKVLPALDSNDQSETGRRPVRAWCAACSTGEEPYSLAMLLAEWSAACPGRDFDILATDIDEVSIQTAQNGVYPEAAVASMEPDRVGRWFTREKGHVRVSGSLARRVRFEVHDLLGTWSDGWTGFDLILCRNLLIYLGAGQQQILYSRFHSVLEPEGFLVLGRTEALLGRARRLYECVDIPNRFYRPVQAGGSPDPGERGGTN